jgi:hypothetical protein
MPIRIEDVKITVVSSAERKTTRKNSSMTTMIVDFGTAKYPDHWYANAYPMEGYENFGEATPLVEAEAGDVLYISGKVRKYQRGDGYNVVIDVEEASRPEPF